MTKPVITTALFATAICFGLTLAACGSGGGGGSDDPVAPVTPALSKTAVLENTATILGTRYTAFSQQSATFASSVTTLCAAPDSSSLALAQQQWKTSMDRWQQIAAIGFGPAGTDSRATRIHSFPIQISTEVSAHADTIISGSAAISEQTVADGANAFQGLNALEYLLFDTDATTLQSTPRRCALAAAVASNVATQAAALSNDWTSYRASFVAATSVDTSTEALITSLVNYLVVIQTRKLIDTVDNADNIESPHADVSIANIRANVGLIEALIGSATDNGFAKFLSSHNASAAGGELSPRMQALKAALDAVNTELVAARTSETADVNALADAVHQVTETFAGSVARGFDVTIEFSGGDGD